MDNDQSLTSARIAYSRFAMPRAEAEAQIAARRQQLKPSVPETDFSAPEPSPFPLVDDPLTFAAEFWKSRTGAPRQPAEKPRSPRTSSRPPTAATPPTLTVIDGGKGGDNEEPTS